MCPRSLRRQPLGPSKVYFFETQPQLTVTARPYQKNLPGKETRIPTDLTPGADTYPTAFCEVDSATCTGRMAAIASFHKPSKSTALAVGVEQRYPREACLCSEESDRAASREKRRGQLSNRETASHEKIRILGISIYWHAFSGKR